MPHGDLETRVLDLAVRQGLVTAEALRDLDQAALGRSSRWGPRLAVLEQRGLLKAEVLDGLAWQILAEGEGTTDGRPTTPPQDLREARPGHPAPWEELPDRYADVAPLGAGGMGRVVRAWDRLLQRPVALKFLRPRESEREQRVLAEARAQAQVEHPNVCKVFDVGEAGGEPYLAMQLIQGEALHRAWQGLDLRERLELLRDVAEGVHASHRAGLLHLDLKPDNVLVEIREGRRHPYVMDFGLGRGVEASGGLAPLGTPPFTSPEQARGDARQLDRRTDVYALGVMLFEAVADASPFDASTYADLVEAILAGRSVPLEARKRDVPRDLALVVGKATAREPSRRYATALALADDLQRYLDGEPISVRPATALYRITVWTRRHPRLALGAGLLALAAGGSALHSWRTSVRAEAQARAAATYGEAMARVQALVRMAHLQPAHDIRGELAVVRGLLAGIRSHLPGPGEPGRGSALHALGRGELTLGRPKEALALFREARAAGLAGPILDLDQGQAEAALYLQDVVGGRMIRDAARRKARLEELDRTLKHPALDRLRRSRAASDVQAHYIEATIAACEDRVPDALKACEEALEHAPWFYEALMLEASVASARARQQLQGLDQGSGGGVQALAATEAPLRRLLQAAPSLPAAYRLEAGRLYDLSTFLEGTDTRSAIRILEEGVARVKDGLRVDPEDVPLLVQQARLQWVRAENLAKVGQDPSGPFAEARAAARRAAGLDPAFAMAPKVHADLLGAIALWKGSRGEPALQELREALESLSAYERLAGTDLVSLRTRGFLLQVESLELVASGGDPAPALQACIDVYRQLLEKLPDDPMPLVNLPRVLGQRFELDQALGRGRHADLEEGLRLAEKVGAGKVHAAEGLANGCYLARLRAREAAARREDPGPWLRRAEDLGARARELTVDDPAPWLELAATHLEAARLDGDPGRRRARLDQAEKAWKRAAVLNPKAAEALLGRAETALLRAEAGGGPAAARTGLGFAERALALNPRSHEARALRGALGLAAGRPAEAARADLAAALKAQPPLRARYGGYGARRPG